MIAIQKTEAAAISFLYDVVDDGLVVPPELERQISNLGRVNERQSGDLLHQRDGAVDLRQRFKDGLTNRKPRKTLYNR